MHFTAKFSAGIFSIIFTTLIALQSIAQVPSYGDDNLLDVGTWNLEWFGDTQNGPTNESLQYTNIKKVLNNTDIDVWGVTEMSNFSTFSQLTDDLPQYGSILATFNQTQKTALFYKKNHFDVVSHRHVLSTASFNYSFASRPPLEVVLATKAPLPIDTIHFLVVHLKAYSDLESYQRRKDASIALKNIYLDNNPTKKIIVLGDWNDDLDVSTYGGLESPFTNILDDTDNYLFATKTLSMQGLTSYAFYSGSFLDHILINKNLFADYMPARTKVLSTLPSQISGFTNNTSDHYPVITSFKFGTAPVANIDFSEQTSTIQLSMSEDGKSVIASGDWSGTINIFSMDGKIVTSFDKENSSIATQSIEAIQNGMYIVSVKAGNKTKSFKFYK